MPAIHPVPVSPNFAEEEEKTLEYWKKIKAFELQLKHTKGKPAYTFYDGPPFATGMPHYGHILAGTIKDIVTRWASMNGYYVQRRFGWDCHGLPIEYEIDKILDIKSPDQVRAFGIDKYNQECRKIVSRFSKEWEEIVTRMGRWIDFRNDYKTMYPWFMESVWWVFKELFNKGLVYRGFKVMPFSTACSTPLSNFEVSQNYKDVNDPEVIVSFPLLDQSGTSMLAWTTTPWTLPSNLALCVHPDKDYVRVKDSASDQKYVLMECRLSMLDKAKIKYEVEAKFKGKTLENLTYKPLFEYFNDYAAKNKAWRVVCDGYVTEDSGTGVVHQSPYFGEDDYRVCKSYGIVKADSKDIVCPVDETGRFMDIVSDFKGLHVKEADKHICAHLKAASRLVYHGTINHSYPFCWRSDTPLIYKAVPCWFIKVGSLKDKLIANNQDTYWVPDFVKEKRFANGLRDAPDWCVSRNRFWGTPMPLWVSEDFEEMVCVGSIEELAQLTGDKRLEDIHREFVDTLTIPSARGPDHPPLRRVEEVFDCWFESGSMPYAQAHYPFENKKGFEDNFPADFIAEGIDQTRGWFYTLSVLASALFGEPPFKNLIVNGLVLAEGGAKMSKRLKNYPDPVDVVNEYGADALRLYLINSPVVRAENLRFRKEGVRDILKDVFLPWFNAYRFLVQNIEKLQNDTGKDFVLTRGTHGNVMDRWIVSYTHSLVDFVRQEMDGYRLYTVVPRLVQYVETLTNWYVKMNRKRLKGEKGEAEAQSSLESLLSTLNMLCRVMAPFTPYLTELMWKNLGPLAADDSKSNGSADDASVSVHLSDLPVADTSLIDQDVERKVAAMQTVVELVRVIRERATKPLKYPVKEVIVLDSSAETLDDVRQMEDYIRDEANARKLTRSNEPAKYGVKLAGMLDMKLGKMLRQDFKKMLEAVKTLSHSQLTAYQETGELELCGHKLSGTDLTVTYTVDADKVGGDFQAHSDGKTTVLVDLSEEQTMMDEGLAREIVNRVQKLRKKANLQPADEVTVVGSVEPTDSDLARVFREQADYIKDALSGSPVYDTVPAGDVKTPELMAETLDIKGAKLSLRILDRRSDRASASKQSAAAVANNAGFDQKSVSGKPHFKLSGPDGGSAAYVLAATADGTKLGYERLVLEAKSKFNLWSSSKPLLLSVKPADLKSEIRTDQQLANVKLNSTIYVSER